MAEHNDFGKLAELYAADYLKKKGYQIITQNYRFQKAEIDLITRYENQLVIVEVKARQNDTLIEPQEAVNKKKIKLLISATDEFMKTFPDDLEVRFDIITVLKQPDGTLQINHIENAFESIDF
ncbi:YraN family protein [Riemerella columbina]|uniref:YraN family protein n=1 Tax=Riemerella columbina TaxID=103810 RepID=UPI000367AE22|nr:YraN family protein [Riemerella columbina]